MKNGVLTACYQSEQNTLLLMLDGKFDATIVPEIEKIFACEGAHLDHYVFDLHACSYIDSEVVGCVLEFCNFANQQHADIAIINMNNEVLESFCLLNLHKFFKPEYSPERQRTDWVYR